MTLPAGSRVGKYEIVSPLGAGGMGEVYRARDGKLRRDVAVKVLSRHLARDPVALARFEREAHAVAALSDPNILAIHDFGRDGDVSFAVTELLEGRTLRERMTRGAASRALPLDKALQYALQIARGLAAAHEKNIVHRDLKPENVFITNDGRVKILDFGVAQLAEPPVATATDSTATAPLDLTAVEVVVGTAAYMAPEQIRGQPVDHRADIFAFGALLYEMLSGQRAFPGDTTADTIVAILGSDPPKLSALGVRDAPGVERIVHRCLEKIPAERFQSARDLAFAIETLGIASAQRDTDPGGARRSRSLPAPAAVALVVVGLSALGGAGLLVTASDPSGPPVTTVRPLTYSGRDSAPTASPDGRTIAFTSSRDGIPRIWLQQLPRGDEVALTSGPDDLARFSPDGSSILFVRTERGRASLYRTPVIGGEARRLIDDAVTADWAPDGRSIVFVRIETTATHSNSILALMSADGVETRELARVENEILRHPRFAPDGQTIAAVSGGFQTGHLTPQILLVTLDGRNRRLAPYRSSGPLSSLIWLADGRQVLYAQADATVDWIGGGARIIRHDVESGEATPIHAIADVPRILDILPADRLVFDVRSARENLREIPLPPLRPAGLSGAPVRWLTRGNSNDRQPVYSADGERVIFSSTRSGNLDLWETSRATGAIQRITDYEGDDFDPAYVPAGKGIVFNSDRSGTQEIWIADNDGSAPRQVSREGFDVENPVITPDGRSIFYASLKPGETGLWRIRPDGTDRTLVVRGAVFIPEVSPDGRYVLYLTGASMPRSYIRVVQVADGAPVPFEIAVDGLRPTAAFIGRARWMPDGKAIAFVGQNETGVNGIFVQEFVPGRDTSRTRRPLAGFDAETETESFAIAPDTSHIVLAGWEQTLSVMIAEGLPGVRAAQQSANR
jgi:serine/threonine protein kinase